MALWSCSYCKYEGTPSRAEGERDPDDHRYDARLGTHIRRILPDTSIVFCPLCYMTLNGRKYK